MEFVSRAGEKLQHALQTFNLSVKGKICADFGSSTGGFVDCLLQNGAKKVYSVDVSYGELAWKLRNDERVIVMERTNAMHVQLPEKVDVLTVDTGWTKQEKVIPNALGNLKEGGIIISLIKLHYEAPKNYLYKGKLKEGYVTEVLEKVKNDIEALGGKVLQLTESPLEGRKGENKEYLSLISYPSLASSEFV